MNAACIRSIARRSLGWVLCIGLLFPLAQAVASAHGVSHVAQAAGHDAKADAGAPARCDLCLLGAAIGGGAPLATPVVPELLTASDAAPAEPVACGCDLAAARHYESRAPPSAPC